MASLGHDVVGVDTDATKIAALSAGHSPFYEPGFEDVLRESLASGRLRFVAAPATDELAGVDVHFIAVGTPQSADSGAADLSYVDSAVEAVIAAAGTADHNPVVVGKSTVPVGTTQNLADRLEAHGITLVWNPEFLREGFAVADTLHPDRIVYGLSNDPDRAQLARMHWTRCTPRSLRKACQK